MKNRYLYLFALLSLGVSLAACAGGEKDLTPQAPAKIAQLARDRNLSGPSAAALLDSLEIKPSGSGDLWAASYGDHGRIWIYATSFATPELASGAVGAMQRAIAGKSERFDPMQSATIAQQPGFRTKDKEDNTQLFVFAKGRWFVGIRGIVVDIDPALSSIPWSE